MTIRTFLAALPMAAGLTAAAAAQSEFQLSAHTFLDYNRATMDGETITDRFQHRQMRFTATGRQDAWHWAAMVDVSGADPQVFDLFIERRGETTVRVGNFRMPGGLEQSSSVYETTLLERSAVSKVNGLGRRFGAALYRDLGPVNLSAGVFTDSINADITEGFYASARAFHARELEGGTLHLGGWARHRQADDAHARLGYGHRPVANTAPRLVSTGAISDSDQVYALEAAWVRGGWSAQGEYARTRADCAPGRCGGSDSQWFNSGYAELTRVWGGARSYAARTGTFGRRTVDAPVGQGGMGAFELTARYELADLVGDFIQGGRQHAAVLGAVWHVNRYGRVMVNQSVADISGSPSALGDGTVHATMARLQIEIR
ncbi:hypothetical protein FKB34_01050 [Glycocaulis profundi]|nr:hypothetical protein FKB34_01050 [Glycocaulis profundi]